MWPPLVIRFWMGSYSGERVFLGYHWTFAFLHANDLVINMGSALVFLNPSFPVLILISYLNPITFFYSFYPSALHFLHCLLVYWNQTLHCPKSWENILSELSAPVMLYPWSVLRVMSVPGSRRLLWMYYFMLLHVEQTAVIHQWVRYRCSSSFVDNSSAASYQTSFFSSVSATSAFCSTRPSQKIGIRILKRSIDAECLDESPCFPILCPSSSAAHAVFLSYLHWLQILVSAM